MVAFTEIARSTGKRKVCFVICSPGTKRKNMFNLKREIEHDTRERDSTRNDGPPAPRPADSGDSFFKFGQSHLGASSCGVNLFLDE